MSEKEFLDVTAEVAKEIAEDVYEDAGKPIAKPTGELVGLIPRAIKAALSPLEKWILQKEYNVEETRKLLEKKLENVSPDQIEAPEPHIAVPAMQYISYCMDNEELREMYANLLACSMKKAQKNGVHPGFVEIIRQLSPDEARILNYMNEHCTIPTITLQISFTDSSGLYYLKDFTDVPEICGCENTADEARDLCFGNLIRLGLIEKNDSFHNAKSPLLERLNNHPFVENSYQEFHALENCLGRKLNLNRILGSFKLTAYGNAFCEICMDYDTEEDEDLT